MQDSPRVTIEDDTSNCKTFFPVCGCSCAQNSQAPKWGYRGVYDFQDARVPQDTMCARPANLMDNYNIQRVCVGMCNSGAGDYHEDSLQGDIMGAEGG